MMFIAKGAPYKTEKETKVWINGKVILLTKNQKVLWEFLYGEVKTYGDLIKYMGKLCMEDRPMRKDLMQQTLMQLKSLGLLAYSKEDSALEKFKMVLSNPITPISDNGINEEFIKKLYNNISKYDNMSVADLIVNMDGLSYTELTNGLDEQYLEFAFQAPHANSVMCAVLEMLKKGNICLS